MMRPYDKNKITEWFEVAVLARKISQRLGNIHSRYAIDGDIQRLSTRLNELNFEIEKIENRQADGCAS